VNRVKCVKSDLSLPEVAEFLNKNLKTNQVRHCHYKPPAQPVEVRASKVCHIAGLHARWLEPSGAK